MNRVLIFSSGPSIPPQSGWPRGLRRCVQVAVHFCGRGFESHFWQHDIFSFLNKVVHESRVAQWKRAGPITQRSVDRNYALLNAFFQITVEMHLNTGFYTIQEFILLKIRLRLWTKAIFYDNGYIKLRTEEYAKQMPLHQTHFWLSRKLYHFKNPIRRRAPVAQSVSAPYL